MNSLAYKFLAEMPDEVETEQDREPKLEWHTGLRNRMGDLLVTLGQKLQASGLNTQVRFEDSNYLALEDDACI
ncbi:MAG: hypothetical protein KF726_09000 [Anaerolineae bacterium]|nr:hypothetical protein [Anaerolineae bacterium]